MAKREIIKTPSEILNTKATDTLINEDTRKLVEDLIDTLESAVPKGAGLAAPQIGVSKRVCIVKKFSPDPNDSEKELETTFILINPRIVSISEPKSVAWEGCLSIPDTYGRVERSKRLKVESEDLTGGRFTLKAEGFLARVVQHEIDHLDGILFTSKVIGETLTEKELDELSKKGELESDDE